MRRKKKRLSKPKPIRKRLRIQRVCFTCRRGIGTISIGAVYRIYKCEKCEYLHLAAENPRRCAGCSGFETLKYQRDVSTKAVIADGYCDSCRNSQAMMDKLVEEGGVYWNCKECGARGALPKSDPISKEIRERTKVEPPLPMGVDFGSGSCLACNPKVVAEQERIKQEALAEAKKQREALQEEAKKKFAEAQAKEDALKAEATESKPVKKTTARKKTTKKKTTKKKKVG